MDEGGLEPTRFRRREISTDAVDGLTQELSRNPFDIPAGGSVILLGVPNGIRTHVTALKV